jgi:hypothetical protein
VIHWVVAEIITVAESPKARAVVFERFIMIAHVCF